MQQRVGTATAALHLLLAALDLFLKLPRVAREQPINVSQLRLLVLLSQEAQGADRQVARELDGHDKPTVDKRLAYLRKKGLVSPSEKISYREHAQHRVTATGHVVVRRLVGRRQFTDLIEALDQVCDLPVSSREQTANIAILSVLAFVSARPMITVAEVRGVCSTLGTKPSVRSRLAWLEARELVECTPKYNAGGANSPNVYRALPAGTKLISQLAPG